MVGGWVDGAFLKAAALLVTTDLENRSGYGARTLFPFFSSSSSPSSASSS
jgi:hypothetical protein